MENPEVSIQLTQIECFKKAMSFYGVDADIEDEFVLLALNTLFSEEFLSLIHSEEGIYEFVRVYGIYLTKYIKENK